jgi:hypothetical protein
MDAITRRASRRPSGLRAAIVIGLALALLGALVGTATGAVTQFQMVIIKNTTSEPIPVAGTVNIGNTPANQNVTVSNFPATQPVSGTVNVGNFPAAGVLATKHWTVDLSTSSFGGSDSAGIQSMNVTDVIIADGDSDNYDFAIGGFKLVANHEGNLIEHFTAAFPASGVGMTCRNSVESCDITVTVLGY